MLADRLNITELSSSDHHHVRAAQGWLELGDWSSANDELERITSAQSSHPFVLIVRHGIYAAAKHWELALVVAETLADAFPEDRQCWINRSFALHKLKRTAEAEALLLPALEKFPKEPLIPYNLACYGCMLGRLEMARAMLERAFALGNAEKLQQMALDDPNLKALW